MSDLNHNVKTIRAMNQTASGVSTQNSTIVDARGFKSARMITLFGAINSGQTPTVKVKHGDDSGLSDVSDISGANLTAAATDDNNMAIIDIPNLPTGGYLQGEVGRTSGNCAVDGVIFELYNPKVAPVTVDTTVAQQVTI